MTTPARIASLLPAATEIVCALGLEDSLVGVSHECDFPPSAARFPVLTKPREFGEGGSRALDRELRTLVRDGLAVFEVDVEALARALPDVIVTQDLCDVCAVSLEDVKAAARAIAQPGVRIVSLHPLRLRDVLQDVVRVGAALDVEGRARTLVRELSARIEAVAARARAMTARPAVLTIEWLDPVMIGGTWMPELVEIAGGRPLLAKAGERAPSPTREELARLAPDVVLVKPCGFPLERTRGEIGPFLDLARELGWPAARPVARSRAIWLADGNAYFNRPGPRIADSLEILAACLHPAEFEDLAARHAGAFARAGTA